MAETPARTIYAYGGDYHLQESLTEPDPETGDPVPSVGLLTVTGGFYAAQGDTNPLGHPGTPLAGDMAERSGRGGRYFRVIAGADLATVLGALDEGTIIWRRVRDGSVYDRYTRFVVKHYRT